MNRISLRVESDLAILRLENAAKSNVLTSTMLDQIEDHCATIENASAIRSVIVIGEGDRAFCAGADIGEWADIPPERFASAWVRRGHRAFDRIARLSKCTVAALNGHALGGGLELAAACDLRIARPGVTMSLPETGIGIVPGWSGTQRLSRLLPEGVLKEISLFRRSLDSARALELGFLAAIENDVLAAAVELLQPPMQASAGAIEVAKYMIHAAVGEDRGAMIEAVGGALAAASEDKSEGVAAFRDKRKPDFRR